MPSTLVRVCGLSGLFLAIGAHVPVAAAQEDHQTCVDVTIGDQRSYSCVNEQMKRFTEQHRASALGDAPYTAGVPSQQAGTFNQAATQERLGNAFGNSVVPQRPAPQPFPGPINARP